jgi:hypothetical protein
MGGFIPPIESRKLKSNFPFLFSKFLFISFWNFGFLENTKDEKSNMLRKRKKVNFWRVGKSKKCKWWMKGEKIKYEITTGLISR